MTKSQRTDAPKLESKVGFSFMDDEDEISDGDATTDLDQIEKGSIF